MRTCVCLCIVLVLSALLTGCGGSGSSTPAPQSGDVSGTLTAPSPQAYTVYVDGAPTGISPTSAGGFTLRSLPTGNHTLALIAPDGMLGAYADVTVLPDTPVDIGPLTPVTAGAIGGMVMKVDPVGVLTPLAGVEVVADPQVYYILAGENAATIFPPPPQDGDRLRYRAITDASGSYLIPAVPPGPYVVTVNVPGLEQGVQWVRVLPGQLVAANFRLKPVPEPGIGTIKGTIRGESTAGPVPIEGAQVTVFVPAPWQPTPPPDPFPLPIADLAPAGTSIPPGSTAVLPPPYYFRYFRTLTNAQGEYSLHVPSGNLQVQVWAPGYAWQSRSVVLAPGQTLILDFLLGRWGILEPSP